MWVRPEFAHFRIFLDATHKLMERIKRDFQERCAYKIPIYPENLIPQFPIGGVMWAYFQSVQIKNQVRGLTCLYIW